MENIKFIIAQERLRQARQSFNLAVMATTICILMSFAGFGLVLLGKANEGTITATGGLASTGYCLKLSKDANDRLDKIGSRSRHSPTSTK